MTNIKNLYGLILAGGFSRRMGQDKALMMYHGKPQIEYVNDLLGKHCAKVFLSKRPDQKTYKEISAIDDTQDFLNIGPLGGILSAMKAYPEISWLVIACDLPFVTNETLEFLIQNRNPRKLATAFKSTHDGLPEPLCAIWEAHGYLKILEFLKKDIHCPCKVLINSNTHLLEQANPQWLDNINDSKEFQTALRRLHA
ncbi:MAG: NTP transferase domain-containing protein [Candidatus Omnitrophica bacterium]|nr:NTP transferase domain-containing protein [Candidatus Omnitrophota bacterium]